MLVYKDLAVCNPQNGHNALFQSDKWDGKSKAQLWLHLFSFAKDQNISLSKLWHLDDPADHFHLPLSEEAFAQYQDLTNLLHDILMSETSDNWQISAGATKFQVSTLYDILIGDQEVLPAIKWTWDTCCQLKHKIFFWPLVNNRLNTRAMLHRKNFFIQDYSCVMCGANGFETRDHFFFTCTFAQVCWSYLSPSWSPSHQGLQEDISKIKRLLAVPFSMELIILAAWSIWTTRNDYIFKGIAQNLYQCRKKFKEELKWIIFRVKRKKYHAFEGWVRQFRQISCDGFRANLYTLVMFLYSSCFFSFIFIILIVEPLFVLFI